MDDIFIHKHALKHGVTADDIEHAWNNFVRKQYRGAPREGEIVAIGYDKSGRLIEMVGAVRPQGILIFHALEPPTKNVLVELRLSRR